MLALSRCEGQSIIIDGNIEVKVVKWSRSSVRLAIQAPREVSIDRDEIWKRMHPGEKSPLEKAELQRGDRPASPTAPANPTATHNGASRMEATLTNGAVRRPVAMADRHSDGTGAG